MSNKFKKLYYKWNDYSKCPNCKSAIRDEINEDYLDGCGSPRLEYDVVCANCGQQLNHYAYGYMEVPETKTEYLKCGKPIGIKEYIRTIIESFKVIFE